MSSVQQFIYKHPGTLFAVILHDRGMCDDSKLNFYQLHSTDQQPHNKKRRDFAADRQIIL